MILNRKICIFILIIKICTKYHFPRNMRLYSLKESQSNCLTRRELQNISFPHTFRRIEKKHAFCIQIGAVMVCVSKMAVVIDANSRESENPLANRTFSPASVIVCILHDSLRTKVKSIPSHSSIIISPSRT